MTEVVLNKGGIAEKTVDASSITIPDLWHIAMHLKDNKEEIASEAVLECWYLAHNLLKHIQENG